MAKLLKLRRGTTSQHSSFTGAEGEVTVDTDKETLVVHDGSTAGGHPVAAEDMANVSSASIAGRLSNDSIATSKIAAGALPSDVTIASINIVDGSIVNSDLNAGAGITSGKLATTGVSAGSYGSSSAIPIVTVNAQGQVTAASTTAIDSTTIANGSSSVSVANNGAITSNANHDFSAGIDVTGNTTTQGIQATGNLSITNTAPQISLVDSNSNSDFQFKLDGGLFQIRDTTNDAYRIKVASDGTVDIGQNLNANGGIDVTGNSNIDGKLTITQNTSTTPEIELDGDGPNFIRFNDDSGGTAGMNLIFRSSPNTIGFETSDNSTPRFTVNHNGQASFSGNLDVGAGLDVTGNITVTGNVDGVDVAALKTSKDSLSTTNGALVNGVTATTQAQSDNSTKVSTTAYVRTAISEAQAFPSGTKMLFQQTSAPTGWTKITSGVNNKALRVVSGSAGSGGNIAFTTVFANRGITANAGNTTQGGNVSVANSTQGGNISVANSTAGGNISVANASTGGTVNSHTLSVNEMPSHSHSYGRASAGNGPICLSWESGARIASNTSGNTSNAGGGGGHSHGFTGGSHNHNASFSGSAHNHNATFSGSAHNHNATFSGSAHNHSISVSNLDMQAEYLDVIIASKD